MIEITDYANLGDNEKILSAAADILGVDNAHVYVLVNDKIIAKFSTKDFSINAILYKTPMTGTYQLILSSHLDRPIDIILCHEAIHLLQYTNGDLEVDIENGTFKWKGYEYSGICEYEHRPWEIEAINGETSLLKQARRAAGVKRKCWFSRR